MSDDNVLKLPQTKELGELTDAEAEALGQAVSDAAIRDLKAKERLGQLLGSWSTRTKKYVEHTLEVGDTPYKLFARIEMTPGEEYSFVIIADGLQPFRSRARKMDYETALDSCTRAVQLCEQLQGLICVEDKKESNDGG